MHQTTSEQSGDKSLAIVLLELIDKGYIAVESKRDTDMDIFVWVGHDENGMCKTETIQVKTMQGNSVHKIVDRGGEIVSKNGKVRNSIDYAERGIHWLVGVDLERDTHWYHHDTYSKIPTKSFSVRKYPADDFYNRTVPSNNAFRRVAWTT